MTFLWNQVCIVSMTRLRTGRSGVLFPAGARGFPVCRISRPSVELTWPSVQWELGGFFRGAGGRGRLLGKQLRYESDHSPPFIAEVKSESTYDSIPPLCLHGIQ